MLILSILAFIILFSSLIIIHELGHFYAAKKSGVKVLEFGLGLGKKIYGRQIGETEFTLNLVPFGGFVRMEGEEDESKDPRGFGNAKLWKRMLITLAGVFMNFVFAVIALTILFTAGTNPILVTLQDVEQAEQAGIIKMGPVNEDGKRDLLEIHPIQKDFPESLWFGVTETYRISGAVLTKVAEIPSEIITNHKLPEGMAGPLGIAEVTHKVTPLGLMALLKLAALLSISLGVMNLLPIPALDGGRFFFQLLEMLLMPFKIKPSEKLENAAHIGGFVLLMGFLVAVTWNDIMRIFFS